MSTLTRHKPIANRSSEDIFQKGAECTVCERPINVVIWGDGWDGKPIVPVVMRHKAQQEGYLMVGLGPDVQSPAEQFVERIDYPFALRTKEFLEILDKELENTFDEGYDVGSKAIIVRSLESIERHTEWSREQVVEYLNRLLEER